MILLTSLKQEKLFLYTMGIYKHSSGSVSDDDSNVSMKFHNRAVRAMNETLKQDRMLREQSDAPVHCSTSEKENDSDNQGIVCFFYIFIQKKIISSYTFELF